MGMLSFFNRGAGNATDPIPMFIAKTGTAVQPITAPPTLFTGPIVAGLETFYVTFGTGKYLEVADKTSTLTNSFYAVYDNGTATPDSSVAGTPAISGRGRLQAGTVNTGTKVVTMGAFKWGRPATDATTTSRAGWYFDLPVSSERLVSNVLDIGPRTGTFNTLIPGTTGNTGACSSAIGSGNQYVIDVTEGSGRYVTSVVGLPGPALYMEGEKSETKSDSTGRRIRTTMMRAITVGQSGVNTASAPIESIPEAVGRLMWRQIYNYQDQKQ